MRPTYKFFLFIISLLSIYSCAGLAKYAYMDDENPSSDNISPSFDNNKPSDGGKCYAKVIIQAKYSKNDLELIIYDGDEDNPAHVKEMDIIISEKSYYWGEKKTDKDCLSADPNGCLELGVVETPEVIVPFTIVTDTLLQPNFIKINQRQYVIESEGGFIEWKEVLCDQKITSTFVDQVSEALNQAGFNNSNTEDKAWNRSLKSALVKYQNHHELPIGQLDSETLNHLGISH